MNRTGLVSKFAETVGIEKASAIVDDAMADLGIGGETELDDTDAQDICDIIQHNNEGYVALVASELRVQLAAQERFDALLGNIPNPAVVVEFEQREPYVKSINEAFVDSFGYDQTDAVGTELRALLSPPGADSDVIRADWWEQTGRSEQEVRRMTASGEVRTYLFRSTIVTRDSSQLEGYGIYTDITERKRREQQLKHQNERLDEFVSIVSHDLRNPLNVASGRTHLLLNDIEDGAVREGLEEVAAAHERMARILDDTLTLARQGRVVGETASVSIETVAADAWQQVETEDATLTVETEASIEADSERLQQLFENLYRNAIEHAGAECTVVVSTPSHERNGFSIADDGPGIPPDDRELVFEHGYSTNSDGTGFGLSIVQSIAEAHGWSVTVSESEMGGARFDIRW
ncbi:PAS domain-containing sensor histidine kinase [Haloarcula sp. CBA1130]|uniref:sensor histidine kinase n=1 Tax=unclassified Haloarcula TaxID=2624677 RepID=UPI001243AB73|nr:MULTISPECIES: PAS domain-containing sensor histidine kinase [unclassified Haloarcula]KAA9398111.1 PAS domain-containing sensor histidine kinase [Haloarcula sp. CBA1129]KAA9402202.1 PAS domain-containing sensor histidine kinase [Haloarcula sp. CBA1130]